jgi:transcriptional regulator with XRE-family HTH domain
MLRYSATTLAEWSHDMSDPFTPTDLTDEEQNALALARAELQMLSDLVALRRSKGYSQQDVADAIGRDKSSISRFERLDADPRLSTIRRYARAVGAIVNYEVSDFSRRAPQPVGEGPVIIGATTSVSAVADFQAFIDRQVRRRPSALPNTPQKRLQAVGS